MASAHLVGVLEDEVLALVQLAADVDDAAQDAPGVLHAQVDLAGKLVGLELLRAQDDVAGRVLHVVAGDVAAEEAKHSSQTTLEEAGCSFCVCVCVCSSPQLQVLGSSQHGAAGPASQFVAVVLQLGGQDGSSLGVQLLTPVHTVAVLKAAERRDRKLAFSTDRTIVYPPEKHSQFINNVSPGSPTRSESSC